MHEKNLLVYLYFLINIGPLLESDRTIINVTQGGISLTFLKHFSYWMFQA